MKLTQIFTSKKLEKIIREFITEESKSSDVYLGDWKYDFGEFDNIPFRELNSRLNSSPNKMLDWLFPKEKMHIVLNEYLNNR